MTCYNEIVMLLRRPKWRSNNPRSMEQRNPNETIPLVDKCEMTWIYSTFMEQRGAPRWYPKLLEELWFGGFFSVYSEVFCEGSSGTNSPHIHAFWSFLAVSWPQYTNICIGCQCLDDSIDGIVCHDRQDSEELVFVVAMRCLNKFWYNFIFAFSLSPNARWRCGPTTRLTNTSVPSEQGKERGWKVIGSCPRRSLRVCQLVLS